MESKEETVMYSRLPKDLADWVDAKVEETESNRSQVIRAILRKAKNEEEGK